MATKFNPEYVMDQERSVDDQPAIVLLSDPSKPGQFDENGWEIEKPVEHA